MRSTFFSSSKQEPWQSRGSCVIFDRRRSIPALARRSWPDLTVLRSSLAATACAAVLLAACTGGVRRGAGGDVRRPSGGDGPLPAATPETGTAAAAGGPEAAQTIDPALKNPRATDFEAYVPPQLIPLDGIPPVYDPQFATAQQAPLDDDELVIAIELEGEAKAYPITVLRFREMVNDELAGWPILVTW